MGEKLLTWVVNLFFVALGAALFYSTWGRKELKIYFLSDLMEAFELSERSKILCEFFVFLFFGCSIAMGVIHPQNAAQAFSAGLGWTGLVGRPKKVRN